MAAWCISGLFAFGGPRLRGGALTGALDGLVGSLCGGEADGSLCATGSPAVSLDDDCLLCFLPPFLLVDLLLVGVGVLIGRTALAACDKVGRWNSGVETFSAAAAAAAI